MPNSSSSSDRGVRIPRAYYNHRSAPVWHNSDNHACAFCTPGHPDIRRRQVARQFDDLCGPFLDYAIYLVEYQGWTLANAVQTAIMRQENFMRQAREEERARRARLRRPRTPHPAPRQPLPADPFQSVPGLPSIANILADLRQLQEDAQ